MILILGSTGYVGQAFSAELQRRGYPFEGVSRRALDYTRFDQLFRLLRSKQPELIINAAGYTGAHEGSAGFSRAEAVNANTLLPQTVARAGYLTRTPWACISTSSLFAGMKVWKDGVEDIQTDVNAAALEQRLREEPGSVRGFTETDEPNATFRTGSGSFYAGTKALAEESLRWFGEGYIWRPGPMFDASRHARNLLSWAGADTTVARPGAGSLTHLNDFVNACLELWNRRAPFGIYHVANPGCVSGKELLEAAAALRHSDPHLEFRGEHRPISAEESTIPCLLDVSKLAAHGITLRDGRTALEATLQQRRSLQSSR